jgi:hypothetical protein
MDDEFEMFAQQHDQRSRNSWLQPRVAVATLEQIRYAEQLRLQIRESYLSRREPSPCVWMTGVD